MTQLSDVLTITIGVGLGLLARDAALFGLRELVRRRHASAPDVAAPPVTAPRPVAEPEPEPRSRSVSVSLDGEPMDSGSEAAPKRRPRSISVAVDGVRVEAVGERPDDPAI